jgi:hypothetical protein
MRRPWNALASFIAVFTFAAIPAIAQESSRTHIRLTGPPAVVEFLHASNRLALVQVQHADGAPLLFKDAEMREPGAMPGNPLAVIIREGTHASTNTLADFRVVQLNATERRLRAYLEHDTMPLLVGMDISIDGSVITWLGQALWNGDEKIEADIYFPLLSRMVFDSPASDRGLFPQTSGSVRAPLGSLNYSQNYVGRMASPVFLTEGGDRGLAWLDDNRADYAPDPGATSLRSYIVSNRFPPARGGHGGETGPIIGIGHTRVFRPISDFGGEATYEAAERVRDLPLRKLGDALDLGPIRTYAYSGGWKIGADWLRQQRAWFPMRVSPAEWYRRTTFVGEEGAPNRNGLGFLSLPQVLEEKRKLGVDLFFIVGFADPEVVGASGQARGDYFFPAQNLGGTEALRKGIEATHRAGGRVMFYVEGLIVWKRSRIGRSRAERWALMERDGRLTEHYKGFWHACPADEDYQQWFADTCAELIRTTGADGFFIDSSLATYNHRCFNPAHQHPHPDVWTWGIRQLLKKVREAVDKVNPETLLFIEGCGDIGREFGDGFIAHGHFWTENTFSEPLVRFLHPQMRQFESWGYVPRGGDSDTLRRWFIWNSVNGHRAYAHNASREPMIELSARVRRYYDSFPEICDSPMSVLDVLSPDCAAQLFEGPPRVLTVGNTSNARVETTLTLPVPASLLLDRVDGLRLPVIDRAVKVSLGPWEYRAFELRP